MHGKRNGDIAAAFRPRGEDATSRVRLQKELTGVSIRRALIDSSLSQSLNRLNQWSPTTGPFGIFFFSEKCFNNLLRGRRQGRQFQTHSKLLSLIWRFPTSREQYHGAVLHDDLEVDGRVAIVPHEKNISFVGLYA